MPPLFLDSYDMDHTFVRNKLYLLHFGPVLRGLLAFDGDLPDQWKRAARARR